MSSYLDQNGTQYLWGKIKTWIGSQGYLKTHQTVTDASPTLSWGATSKVATIGNTDIHVTMPSNPNTHQKAYKTMYIVNTYGGGAQAEGISATKAEDTFSIYSGDDIKLTWASDTKRLTISAPAVSGKVSKSGDTMTGALTMAGTDIVLGTPSSSSNDSSDLVWRYGNSNEKMRIWSPDSPTAKQGPNFRIYKSDGTSLFSGTLSLSDHTHSYLPLSGGTLTGALNTANNTWNKIGDDAWIGDYNKSGSVCIKGNNGNTKLYFVPYSGSTEQYIEINGSGTMSISGGTFRNSNGNIWAIKTANGEEANIGAQNTGTDGKSIYLFARNNRVGVYSNIGLTLIGADQNKKIDINGADYAIGAPAKFRAALGLGDADNTYTITHFLKNSTAASGTGTALSAQGSGIRAVVKGGCVGVQFSGMGFPSFTGRSTLMTNSTTAFRLPAGRRPFREWYSDDGNFVINAEGYVFVNPSASGKTVWGCATFPAVN